MVRFESFSMIRVMGFSGMRGRLVVLSFGTVVMLGWCKIFIDLKGLRLNRKN